MGELVFESDELEGECCDVTGYLLAKLLKRIC